MDNIDLAKIAYHLKAVNMGYSQYEFENFLIESCPTPARKLIMVMEQILDLQTTLSQADSFSISSITYDKEKAKLDKLLAWYNSIEKPEEILKNFEAEESEYWSHILGQRAAIEILSLGKTSPQTLEQMSQLPTEDFTETVKICVKFANLIRNITEQTEQEVFPPTTGVVKT